MANKTLFQSTLGKLLPRADARNSEHAPAFKFSDKHALAQLAATGCLNGTFYATAGDQLDAVLTLAQKVEPEFVAKTALYARRKGAMKDMPALLCAVLSVLSPGLMAEIFDRVIDTPKMLRTFVQIMRSGAVGRKSLGTLPKRLVRRWLDERADEALFVGSVGNDPSLADVIKMVHPKPASAARAALYGYLIGREHDAALLPPLVAAFEAFKRDQTQPVPDVPFQMLTALPLTKEAWKAIAANASWQTTRMNLNTFQRHGMFDDDRLVRAVAHKLADRAQIAKARAFPYQLMSAFKAAASAPGILANALQQAMEIATENVPAFAGKVFVFVDVSGSMRSPVTGHRTGATTAVRCVDVAALVAATVLRRNPTAEVIAFEQGVVDVRLNPRDSVMTNAEKLAAVGGGGTNCSAPLARLNRRRAHTDLVVYVSDFESWVDTSAAGRSTATMQEWAALKTRCPNARMACIDLVPNRTTQAAEGGDVLNVGGFSDAVFDVLDKFAHSALTAGHWVAVIEAERI
jgi:60 kDa SS-A/Ro ribonucleoprotein